MKQVLIDYILDGVTADAMVMLVLQKLPDEAFESVVLIRNCTYENGADWATRQFQSLCRKYLSDDKELMKLIDEDEKYKI